jgi:large subunit ribosomal protein L14e
LFLFASSLRVQVLVDGPQEITGIHRQVMTLKRLSLTDVVAKGLKRGACQKNVKAAWASQNVKAAWESCAWAQKLSNKAKRDSLGDFDRFKLMVARKQRATLINAKL